MNYLEPYQYFKTLLKMYLQKRFLYLMLLVLDLEQNKIDIEPIIFILQKRIFSS